MQPTILVPLDGSTQGEDALPLAVLLAERLKARLHLVHVHENVMLVVVNDITLGEIPTVNKALDDQCQDDERCYLDVIAGQLRANGFTVSTDLLLGMTDAAIGRVAAAVGARLIVMSSHARIGVGRTLLGSLADDLIRHSGTPVLLTRILPADIPDMPLPPFRHVLVALDGSLLAERILSAAELIAGAFAAELTMLTVTGVHSTGSQRSAIQQYLDGLVRRSSLAPACVHAAMVAGEEPAAAIQDYARRHNADVIALTTHGRGGLRRLLLGSVADRIVHVADCPVLVCRPEDVAS